MSGKICKLLRKEKETQDTASPGPVESNEEICRLITNQSQLDTSGKPMPTFFDPVSKGSSVVRLQYIKTWQQAVQAVCGSTETRQKKDYQGYVKFLTCEVREIVTDKATVYVNEQNLRLGVRTLQILDITAGIYFHAEIHYADVQPQFSKRHRKDIRSKLYLAMKDRYQPQQLCMISPD